MVNEFIHDDRPPEIQELQIRNTALVFRVVVD